MSSEDFAAPALTRSGLQRTVGARAEAAREGRVAGLVVAASVGGRQAVAGVGEVAGGRPAPDARTLFRIASLTKTVTGALLESAVDRGELGLDDAVSERLPDGWRLPAAHPEAAGPIRVRHLAEHSSGLPHNLPDGSPLDDRAGYGAALAGSAPVHAPGARRGYSNLGAQLLGWLLVEAAGADGFGALVAERVAGPHGLHDLVEELPAGHRARLAPGHDPQGAPVPTPVLPLGAPSGGLYGSAADLLGFARARRTGRYLAWQPAELPGTGGGHWHDGALPGYASYLGSVPEFDLAVVVLANSSPPVRTLGEDLLADLTAAQVRMRDRATRSKPSRT